MEALETGLDKALDFGPGLLGNNDDKIIQEADNDNSRLDYDETKKKTTEWNSGALPIAQAYNSAGGYMTAVAVPLGLFSGADALMQSVGGMDDTFKKAAYDSFENDQKTNFPDANEAIKAELAGKTRFDGYVKKTQKVV